MKKKKQKKLQSSSHPLKVSSLEEEMATYSSILSFLFIYLFHLFLLVGG